MTRKNIIYFILIGVALINITMTEIFNTTIPLLFYFLYITFHVISLIFYRETKLITTFHVFSIINYFGYVMFFMIIGFSPFWGLVSLLGSILTMFVAFGVVLQHRTFRLTERSFMWFSLYTIVFYSMYTPYILNLLTNFFGPFPLAIQRTINAFQTIRLILYIGNVALQILIIHRNEINKKLEEEDEEANEERKRIASLPFFK